MNLLCAVYRGAQRLTFQLIYKRMNHTQPIVSRNGRHCASTTLRLPGISWIDSPQ